jgi:hypothetical protein
MTSSQQDAAQESTDEAPVKPATEDTGQGVDKEPGHKPTGPGKDPWDMGSGPAKDPQDMGS